MENWVAVHIILDLMKKQIVINVSFSGAVSDCRHALKPGIVNCSRFAETITQLVEIHDEDSLSNPMTTSTGFMRTMKRHCKQIPPALSC